MAIWDVVVGPLLKIIDKVIPDKTAAAAAKAQIQTLALQGQLTEEMAELASVTSAQSDINKVEASSSSLFVSGWRPLIGWICGIAFGFQFILRPVIQWGFIMTGHPLPALPGIDETLTQLTYGMLGMGALRTYEKAKGVAGK